MSENTNPPAPTSHLRVLPTSITDVMQTAYISYSMSVIISRALPDARDGLKPVQRRVLYAMLKEGLLHNRPFDKCAGVVGEVLKNYHPHGDSSVYDTLVRLGQHWVMRYPLIDPQGNFGSVDGDPPAAYRYTEARMTAMAETMLADIDEDTVDFQPNYKESTTEPTVLPAALPHLLMNGSMGIAVGMTTNIPPHNLGELVSALNAMIDNPAISLDELIKHIPGPDFPTGGAILGRDGIEKYLRTGRGSLKIRGIAGVEEVKGGREQIIITELPYNVNRASLVTQIAQLASEKTLEGVSDVRDESDERTRVVVEIKRGEDAKVVLNNIYKMTQLENNFSVILLALVNRRPKEMNIKEILEVYIEHRRAVVMRRTAYRKRKAEDRAHILEGYKIALDNLDDFVKIIRASANREEAKQRLLAKYPLSERQVDAILDLRLYQLTGMERGKIEEEYAQLMKLIAELKEILGSEKKLLKVIKEELTEVAGGFTSPRRTQLVRDPGDLKMEDLIANEGCLVTVTHSGFIKRTPFSAYRSQKRGGKGIIAAGSHDEDFVEQLFDASTHDYIMFFMNNGRVYVEKVYDIPEGARTAKGRMIANLLELKENEKLAAVVCIKDFAEDKYVVLATKNGIMKKTSLADYKNFRKGGTIGIVIDDDDQLIAARTTVGHDEIMAVTGGGMSIRFSEEDLRDQGRATRGVKGITLKDKNDRVVTLEVVHKEQTLLIAGRDGYGKRTSFEEYRLQGRGGSGIIAMKTDDVAGALSVGEADEIMLITQQGQSVRTRVREIRVIGRTTQGVRLINLAKGDTLVGICRVAEPSEEEGEAAESE
jgi:DNA gyrase subunit A